MYTFTQLGFPINKHITLIQELHAHFTYFSSYIRRSPAPSSIGTPTNNHLVTAYHQMHDSATLRASPAPSTASMMSSSSRASSTLRSIKNQSPVVMNTAKSMQVQKPVRQAATAPSTATSEMTNTVGPSFAQPLTKRMAVVPECSTPVTGTVAAPPPPSYEISLQQKEVISPITVPRTDSPSIQSPQVASDNRPPPPPYRQMKPPMYPPTDTTNSSSRSGTPYSESQNSENTDSSSPVDFQDRTLTPRDSGYGQSAEAMLPPAPPPYTRVSPKPERKFPGSSNDAKDRKSCVKSYSPDAYKFFMEKHYDQDHGKVWKYYNDRKERLNRFYNEIGKVDVDSPFYSQIQQFKQKFFSVETEHLRQRRKIMKKSDFHELKVIGKGGFGKVSLVRKSGNTNNINLGSQITKEPTIFAMKTLLKSHIVEKGKVAHVMAEKDILSEANIPWIVQMYHSFQDKEYLYFIMEYVPGGDLMERLIREQLFSENDAKFYTAQLICAVECVHAMGFVHRDIKPDNILIDRGGNLKLSDFGLSTGFRWTHESDKYLVNGGKFQ